MSFTSRRRFIQMMVAVPATATVFSERINANTLKNNQYFVKLSYFVTNKKEKDIDNIVLERAYDAFQKTISNFDNKLQALNIFYENNNFSDIKEMSMHPDYHKHREFIQTLIHGYYVGYAGEQTSWHLKDKEYLIAFPTALMYKITENAVPVPSFSLGQTNFWTKPPKSILEDNKLTPVIGVF